MPYLAWLCLPLACPAYPASLQALQPPIEAPIQWTADARQDAAPRSADAVGSRRILRLADGRSLQAVARLRNGVWEMKRGRDYQPLPAGSVLSAEPEKTVLARWKEPPEDERTGSDHVRRGFELGLQSQSLQALEKLLIEDPIASEPVALVAEHAQAFRRPRIESGAAADSPAVLEVAKWGAGNGPIAAELAILDLARCGDRKQVQAKLAQWLEEGSPERRAFAAHSLRRLAPRAQPKPLMRRAVLDGSENVREQASLALAAASNEALTLPIVRALSSSHPTIRTRAAQSLGLMGYSAAVPALVTRLAAAARGEGGGHAVPHQHIFVGTQSAYVQDFDVEVAAGSSIADPSINTLVSGAVLDVGVRGVEIQHVLQAERRVLVKSLQQLTGANPGRRAKDWSAWYERNRSRFEGTAEGAQTRVPR